MELSTDIKALLSVSPQALNDFVTKLSTENERLIAENATLRARLNQNCTNSSVPPSKNNFVKPKSLRVSTGRKPGGQHGHKGSTLRISETPDVIIEYKPCVCEHCDAIIPSDTTPIRHITRQNVNIKIHHVITEHRAGVSICPDCGRETMAAFPEQVKHYLQYGPLYRALILYLNQGNFIPFDRLAQFSKDVLKIPVSTGTLVNIVQKSALDLDASMNFIKEQLKSATVVHFDETGTRVDGKTIWRHSAGNDLSTYLKTHQKRGNEATDAIGILPFFGGISVHDFWKSYFAYINCNHAMCNAHLLRELNGIEENDKQVWPTQMKAVLLDAKKLLETKESPLSPDEIASLEARYDQVLLLGNSENPIKQTASTGPKKQGRVAKSKASNLLERMSRYKENILLFLHILEVPFDNNLAERDIRMSKTQQKVSGGFRSKDGCDAFDMHRSYIATAIKHGISVFDASFALTSGQPLFTKPL
jgi:transposase